MVSCGKTVLYSSWGQNMNERVGKNPVELFE